MAALGRPQSALPIAKRLAFRSRRPPEWDDPAAPQRRDGRGRGGLDRDPRSPITARRKAAAAPVEPVAGELLVPGRTLERPAQRDEHLGNGAELDRVSVQDYVRYEDSGTTGGSMRGTCRLFETLAEGLPVACKAAVSRIDHGGRAIRLETMRGTLPQRG